MMRDLLDLNHQAHLSGGFLFNQNYDLVGGTKEKKTFLTP